MILESILAISIAFVVLWTPAPASLGPGPESAKSGYSPIHGIGSASETDYPWQRSGQKSSTIPLKSAISLTESSPTQSESIK